ncbi:prophage CP4-57 regulatory protein [Pseudomonas psychrotolerans L19]|uniref:helix-turn-helix transcriptional regulator n=1 Tax=Pseudomonas oryzihabitans TaxID=47885 RepID=UPI00023A306F|nr:AlpA family phage regulatory protein [Pseudomonas psychrotolerans]EHK68636.1 prophage CP4-57 regulatory protein [Pseudomonas psychrotolerans L19]
MATNETRRFIRRHQVEAMTSLSRSEIYRRIAAGTFPAQVKIGAAHAVWIESEVAAWVDARIAESRGEAA